jgi:hypothetical protein
MMIPEENKVALRTLRKSTRLVGKKDEKFERDDVGDRGLKLHPLPIRNLSFKPKKISQEIGSNDKTAVKQQHQIEIFRSNKVFHKLSQSADTKWFAIGTRKGWSVRSVAGRITMSVWRDKLNRLSIWWVTPSYGAPFPNPVR